MRRTQQTAHWTPEIRDAFAPGQRIEDAYLNAIRNTGAEMTGEWFQSKILPWARQVAETERKRIESQRP